MKVINLLRNRLARLPKKFSLNCACHLVAILTLTLFATIPAFGQAPVEVGSQGYINGTPQTVHTTAAFNTTGASTLVAFVSTDTPWNGVPVSISGVSDNLGNSWQVLTGPTSWNGSSYGQQSGIYYVNVPVTSAAHTVTVHLTNPAPLVVEVFAVSGSDITGPPLYSAITDPGTGGTSASVVTAPITVPADTLLLSWAKNETGANATAIDGYSLDASSTSFLWAETETAASAGAYTGDFQYDASIGWQTAVVGLKPARVGPVAFSQAVTVGYGTPASITLTAESPGGFPLSYSVVSGPVQGTLSGTAPNLTYTASAGYAGSDAFTFKANDGTGDSNVATVSLTVRGPNHAPVASDMSVTAAAGSATPVTLTASDADGDALTYIIVSPPAHGQLSSGTGANRTYTPNAGYTGSDSFTFKANDGLADSNVATVSVTVSVVAPAPVEVGSQGYINGTPQTVHTTAAFNTTGASTLVAFVSTDTPWNGVPVSISGVSDNLGNSWQVLTGPTSWNGSSYGQQSGIYYVNVPVTSAAHTVTVHLTNPAPLVVEVFAVSGSDITGPPLYSAITDPGTGGTSASVVTAPITVPADTLLLSWAKNETGANATAIDGYSLDASSTSFLWAETETAASAGAYTGDFQYDASIGWQTAVVGLKPARVGPVAFSQAVTVGYGTPASITLTAESPGGFPLSYSVVSGPVQGTLSGTAPNLTYTASAGYAGSDAFTFKANDGTGDSNVATVSLTVRGPNHAPVASDMSVTAAAGSATPVTLTASDADGDALTYIIVSPPAHGQLSSGTGANRTYTPNAGYTGSDSFTFKANDGLADSNVATVSVTVSVVAPAPVEVSSQGYINTTPLTVHTTAAFNTTGASTLVAFVGSHSPWNGMPVSISGVSDNLGNSWQVLTGPTSWNGESFPMLGAIYYVNVPVTSAAHTVTVHLTNPAPLVVEVFAVSGSDITGPPLYSAITDPGTGGTSASVVTAPITVPADTLLLSWAKNETGANATAIDGYTLDASSTSYLWAETETAASAGAYTGDFQYDASIGWQTAVVGLKPASGPAAPTNTSVVMAWTAPAAIAYGTPLSATQLNATASYNGTAIAGTLTYSPAIGTVLNAGANQRLSVVFTPSDTTNFSTPAAATTSINVTQATPMIAWTAPAATSYGTPLSATQLNATAIYNGITVAGTFTYSPAIGTVLNAAANQTLSVTFTPSNTTNFSTPAPATTSINVTQGTLTLAVNDATRVYGTANPAFSGTMMGPFNGDAFTQSFSTAATLASNAGTYAIVPAVTGPDLSNYVVNATDGTLTVTPAETTTALTVSSTSITPGTSVTLTAQVTSSTTGTPTGTVIFYDGTTLLGTASLTAGTASYSTTSLASGVTHALSATYSGDINFTASASTSAIGATVTAMDFTFAATGQTSQTVMPGDTATFTYKIAPTGGAYPGAVSFTVSGLPSGTGYSLPQSTLAANAGTRTVTMTITTAGLLASSERQKQSPWPLRGRTALAVGVLLPLGILRGARRLREGVGRGMLLMLLVAAGSAAAIGVSGCGVQTRLLEQGPQSYTLTITATSGTVQHSSTVNLNLK